MTWSHFPHCPKCSRRLWSETPRRARDPRGPVKGPTRDGRCPHCATDLYREEIAR